MNELERELYICACHSPEHQMLVTNDENNHLIIEYHLKTYKGFWKRLVTAVRYLFGYRSKYGEWDSIILDEENQLRLYEHLKQKFECQTKIKSTG